jgi:uncharacterized protein (TIGR03435 family)
MSHMTFLPRAVAIALAVIAIANGQPPAGSRLEFDAASIKPAAPPTGHFQFGASSKGGPGTADATTFRCSNCNLAFLITKAFQLEPYQLPGQSSLPGDAFDVSARVPPGTTPEQFAMMLQNLLKDRFGLSGRFESRQMQGYQLVVAKNGPRLKESQAPATPPAAPPAAETDAHQEGAGKDWHSSGNDSNHWTSRPGLTFFNGQARYRGDHQSMGDLARMISSQLSRPVDDRTGLKGAYDISLSWSDDGSHAASHFGNPAFGDHGGAGHNGAPQDEASGPTLMGALQAQLGLRLEAKKATANIFVIAHVEKSPTANE